MKLLGLGGIEKDALILEAKRNLYIRFPYNPNIKLSNFSVDFKNTFVFIYSLTKVTVSADVYDCSKSDVSSSEKAGFDQEKLFPIALKEGDSLLYDYNEYYPGKFLKYLRNDKLLISVQLDDDKSKRKMVKENEVFKTSKHADDLNFYGFNIGDQAYIEVDNLKTNIKNTKPCIILGLNYSKAIISYTKDNGEKRIVTVNKVSLKK